MDTSKIKESLKSPTWRTLLAVALVFALLYLWQSYFVTPQQPRHPIDYSQFLLQLEVGNINSVSIRDRRVRGEFFNETELRVNNLDRKVQVKLFETYLPVIQGEELLNKLESKNVTIDVEPADEGSPFWRFIIGILPWVLIIGFWIYIMRRTSKQFSGGPGGLFQFGESKAKLYDVTRPRVTFEDVAGLKNVKKDLEEMITFLKDPGKFRNIGAKVPKGVLLVGPPGTGKTLLARATAGEAGVPFYTINASEFIEMFVGVGASRVRDLFRKAKQAKPSIIFIDEIDAVGRTRGTGLGGGHDEREQTLNQLLAEIDGFDPNEEVIVMAATNRPDVLDPALLRPGRFDRRIVIDRPGKDERKEILLVHSRNKRIADDVDLDRIARGTVGMTGADLENLMNEAALLAVRKSSDVITNEHIEEARDKLLMGALREEKISDLEKRITAYHESGHTLVAWNLPGSDPIHKVSILPRGMAMGVTQQLPKEDRHYYPKAYLITRLAVMLAGRMAEIIVFNDVSTGAQNDLKESTSLAEKMVAQWGMSEKVGPLNLGRGEEHPFLGRELSQPKHYSEKMAWIMDEEIRSVILEAQQKAEEVLKENRDKLDVLAKELMKEETLDENDLKKILGEPKSPGSMEIEQKEG